MWDAASKLSLALAAHKKKRGRANNNAWCELWAETMGRLWFFTTSALPKQVKRPSRTSCHSHHPQLLFLPFTVFRDACFQSVTLQNKRVLRFSQRNYCKTNCSNSKRHRLLGLGFSKTRLGMVFPLWFLSTTLKRPLVEPLLNGWWSGWCCDVKCFMSRNWKSFGILHKKKNCQARIAVDQWTFLSSWGSDR